MGATRRITADTRDKIRKLVDSLAPLLPLSTHSRNAVTFRTIFGESGKGKLLEGRGSKRQALQRAWEEVVRRHPRMPFTLIRKIIPAGIEYRRFKRDPVTREELDAIADALAGLGFDMRSELAKIDVAEELPRITVPPAELVRRLENHPLHQRLAGEPLELFRNGHFNEAVRKATERFEDEIRERTGSPQHGRGLMSSTFRAGGDLVLDQVEAENQQDFQEGYMHLSMGLMAALRNVFSHGDEERRSPEECFEMLLFLNWMLRHLDLARPR